MPPVLDVDVLLLFATALAAKRRPAQLVEIVAALDLVQGNVPSEEKLAGALVRLGESGLLLELAEGIALTPDAEKLIEILPRKGDYAQRLFELRGLLGGFKASGEGRAIVLGEALFRAAILAHRAAAAGVAKNLLVPKPKPEAAQARLGQRQRKPMPKARKR